MEKFRAFLEVVKKYHFWVLCGLIVFLSFGSWFWATGSEEKNFVTRKGSIEGKPRPGPRLPAIRASQRRTTSSRSATGKAVR